MPRVGRLGDGLEEVREVLDRPRPLARLLAGDGATPAKVARRLDEDGEIDPRARPLVQRVQPLDDDERRGLEGLDAHAPGPVLRIAIGPRDMENGTVEVARRDTMEKQVMQVTDLADKVVHLLEAIQDNLYRKALAMREAGTRAVDSYDEFKVEIEKGGFLLAHWDGTPATEARVKEETKATIRCIPLDGDATPGKCMVTGMPSARRVIFARAY